MTGAMPDSHGPSGEPPPARVYGLDRYRRRPTPRERTARVGMAVFLGSWVMLFAGLFFAYAFVRARAPAWPPLDAPPLPRLLPGLNTAVIAAASVAVARAVRARELGRSRSASRSLAVASALGAIFVALQVVVWAGLWRAGLVPSGGPFPSVFYAFTAFHALHVLVGLAALSWLAVSARGGGGSSPDLHRPAERGRGGGSSPDLHRPAERGRGGGSSAASVRLWGWYWHFVGALWLGLYVTVFLL